MGLYSEYNGDFAVVVNRHVIRVGLSRTQHNERPQVSVSHLKWRPFLSEPERISRIIRIVFASIFFKRELRQIEKYD